MPQFSDHVRLLKLGTLVAAVAASGLVLAACSTPNGLSSSTSTSTSSDTSSPTDNAMMPESSPTSSPASDVLATPTPATPAQTTNQAATSENAQIGRLNQDSTSVDNSLNDQPVNVNQ